MQVKIWSASLFFLVFSFNVFSQNKSYAIIYDTVNAYLSKGNYNKAKSSFELLLKEYQVDPAERLQFAQRALDFDDVSYFKKEAFILLRDFGWHYAYQDTLREGTNTDQIKKHDLVEWLVKKSDLYYPKWVKKNPIGFLIQQEVEKLCAID